METGGEHAVREPGRRLRTALWIGAPLLLAAAGLVLWSGRAAAVFLDSASTGPRPCWPGACDRRMEPT
jgi:hypothetical protein